MVNGLPSRQLLYIGFAVANVGKASRRRSSFFIVFKFLIMFRLYMRNRKSGLTNPHQRY